jgi:hypothetical protein
MRRAAARIALPLINCIFCPYIVRMFHIILGKINISVSIISLLDFIMEIRCVFCELEIEFLCALLLRLISWYKMLMAFDFMHMT